MIPTRILRRSFAMKWNLLQKPAGTGIAKRSPDYIKEKMREGKAVIAFTKDGIWAGFCYIETWSHGEYVANSGLIVAPLSEKADWPNRSRKKYSN